MKKKSWRKVRILARGSVLKHARINRGFSAQAFATVVNISKQQVYMIEKGTSGTSEATAVRMAKILGKSFAELFEIVWPDTESMEKTLKEAERANSQLALVDTH